MAADATPGRRSPHAHAPAAFLPELKFGSADSDDYYSLGNNAPSSTGSDDAGVVATTTSALPENTRSSSGIPDRRKSQRPSATAARGKKSGRGLGPKLPVKPAPTSRMSSGTRPGDDGESSDAFEDAASTNSRSRSRNNSMKSDSEQPAGLGINGSGEDDGESARLSKDGSDDQDKTTSGHSRQKTAEKVPSPVSDAEDEKEQLSEEDEEEDKDQTPVRSTFSHSRQSTMEVAPALVTEPATPTLASSVRSGLKSHSRQSTAEDVPVLAPQPMEDERERSVSPTKKPTRGLSGNFRVSSPPSSIGRVQALEHRNSGGESSTSPPAGGGLMRSASTRMGAFLGRMGSMRKPGRSPPGPRQEGRFAPERRNTGQSMTSMASNGGDGLTSISDGPEGDGEAGVRPSLQDQFQSLRKKEEYYIPGANGQVVDGDHESALKSRTTSDAGAETPTSPTKESPETRSRRASSTVKTPPMNPSLPPGTASGLTAGPAEEPRPVDWDLWQAVVYEGPSALAKSSGDELKQAIASGIPAAIRGVVWQVLAESKNAELENVYRTLKARGPTTSDHLTAPETQRPDTLSRNASQTNVDTTEEKESEVSSSRASVHSDPENSTPATSNMASPPASVQGDEQDLKAKLLAEKQKREAAALAKLEKAIKRDLGSRTSYSKFTQAPGLQDGLFGVCKAYALFDEGVGYAQGINFIAMPLLFNMSEEEAFTLLVRLMSKYDLRSMFTGDLAGLHLRLYQFERLLEDHDPALYCHLRRRNVGPQLYATQWFLTLFAYRFPLQLVLRVYDLIISDGLTAILKFGLVLLQHNRDTLLGMKDMSHLTTFLKEKVFDVYIDKSPSASSLLDSGFFGSVTGGADKELYRADEMVRDACEIQIPETTLAQYTAEWEESQRASHERDSELEHLRTSNIALTAKVKELEERTQQQDSEHVTIAGDLVRIKVENESLLDENEGLKVRNVELQKMVDAQPAEVEEKLKDEMDRILQRNSEVQSENRVLKEEMEEMETELVNAKMARAQTQSEYDALVQKWGNMKAILGDQ